MLRWGGLMIMVMILAAGFSPASSGDGEYDDDGCLRVGLLIGGRAGF